MENTYWTRIEDGHYRVHNGILKYAANKINDTTIDLDKITVVKSITFDKLRKINEILRSNFKIEDFKK